MITAQTHARCTGGPRRRLIDVYTLTAEQAGSAEIHRLFVRSARMLANRLATHGKGRKAVKNGPLAKVVLQVMLDCAYDVFTTVDLVEGQPRWPMKKPQGKKIYFCLRASDAPSINNEEIFAARLPMGGLTGRLSLPINVAGAYYLPLGKHETIGIPLGPRAFLAAGASARKLAQSWQTGLTHQARRKETNACAITIIDLTAAKREMGGRILRPNRDRVAIYCRPRGQTQTQINYGP